MKLLVAHFSSTIVLPAPSCIQILPAAPRSQKPQVSQPIPVQHSDLFCLGSNSLPWDPLSCFSLVHVPWQCLKLGHDHFLPCPSQFTINDACYSLQGLLTYLEDVLNAPSTPPVCCLQAPELSADGSSFYTQWPLETVEPRELRPRAGPRLVQLIASLYRRLRGNRLPSVQVPWVQSVYCAFTEAACLKGLLCL